MSKAGKQRPCSERGVLLWGFGCIGRVDLITVSLLRGFEFDLVGGLPVMGQLAGLPPPIQTQSDKHDPII